MLNARQFGLDWYQILLKNYIKIPITFICSIAVESKWSAIGFYCMVLIRVDNCNEKYGKTKFKSPPNHRYSSSIHRAVFISFCWVSGPSCFSTANILSTGWSRCKFDLLCDIWLYCCSRTPRRYTDTWWYTNAGQYQKPMEAYKVQWSFHHPCNWP